MVSVILLAGGSSNRFGGNKMKALLGGVPVFLRSLIKFYKNPQITEIIIICKEEEIEDYKLLQKQFPKIKSIVVGGARRQDSVANGVKEVTNEITLIHNGANPLVTDNEIEEVISATKEFGAAAPGLKVKNTLKKVDENGFVIETIDREGIWEMQTPQGVKTEKFKILNLKFKIDVTDDVSFFELAGLPVKIVQASEQNFKITTQEDLVKAQNLIKADFRIGIGHDSHKFRDKEQEMHHYEEGNDKTIQSKKFKIYNLKFKNNLKGNNGNILNGNIENCLKIKNGKLKINEMDPLLYSEGQNGISLGGIQIPHSKTFEANSDGDVLIHAICNAIGTAIGEGSLSHYADEMCKNGTIDSSEYLKHIVKIMKSKGYVIGNISASIEAKEPKLEKYIPDMKEKLSKLLECTPYQIGIACTTGEGLSDFGKGLGMQCFVNVVLKIIT